MRQSIWKPNMARHLALVFSMLAAINVPLSSAQAELTTQQILFIKADKNGDLLLSRAEVLSFAIEQFSITDSNGNDLIEKQEIGDLASDREFSDNDADRSGSLSLRETIDEKLADFDRLDVNKDGKLSLEEISSK